MSIFASRNTSVVTMADGTEVTIRQLTGRQLERARQAHLVKTLEMVRSQASMLKELESLVPAANQAAAGSGSASTPVDPMASVDKPTVVLAGVVAWSADVPVSDEAVGDLSEDAVDVLATAIMRLTKPSLFLSADAQEAEEKNG